jgi:hypothetical protein
MTSRRPGTAGATRLPSDWWARVQQLSDVRLRAIVWVALSAPFVIAAIVLHSRDWHPVLDLAMTELRVRDVGTADTPLIGLPGRIGIFPDQGSHPGPLSFYLLAPTYRVLGASAWALLIAMIVLNIIAIGLALWVAQRRGGRRLMVAVASLLALLEFGYGFDVLTQPWNPYLPLLFWTVILLATWGVVEGDHAMLLLVTCVASLCAQTHLPYLGLGLGMGALCCVAIARHWLRHPAQRNQIQRWLGLSALVGLVLWIPVLVDELTETPGNLSMLNDYFRHPPEPPVGAAEGLRLMLRHLDVVHLVRGVFDGDGFITEAGFRLDGSIVPGALLLVVWLAAAAAAWRIGHRELRSMHLVAGWALVLGAVSMSRIFGKVWYYLTLWAWTTTIFVAASIVWTVAAVVQQRRHDTRAALSDEPLPRRVLGWGVAVVGAVSLVAAVATAFEVRAPEQHLSDSLARLVGPTAAALDRGDGDAAGHDGRYVVTWNDARNFGSQGYGLVDELERRGFDVGVPATWRVPVTPQRVIEFGEATAEVRLATGIYVDQVGALPGAVPVVEYDPRSPAELAESDRLRASITEALVSDGSEDLVGMLDTNLFGLQVDPRVPPDVQQMVDRMLYLGGPIAVFILPPGSSL